jgi:hypothetical protein
MFLRMHMRITVLVAAMAIATTALGSAAVFGPKNYAVTAGKPQAIDDAFALDLGDSCDGHARYFLAVENGGVSSAIVTLNGATLLSEQDFPGSQLRELLVTPSTANHLVVTVKGGTGALRITLWKRIEETVLGPNTLAIDHGPATANAMFNVTDASGVFTLALLNHGIANASMTVNGTTIVSPADLISISASGSGGNSLQWMLYRELDESFCAPTVTIDTPGAAETVTTRRILVTGTASGSRGIGVAVNGQPAEVDWSAAGTKSDPFHWFVSIDALRGTVALHATATNAAGATGTDDRTISYQTSDQTILIRPTPEGGAIPLNVNVDFSSSLVGNIASYDFDLDGDGTYEVSSATRPANLTRSFATAGTRTIRARVTTTDGRVFTSTAFVVAQPFAVVNEIIRAAWSRFTAAMAAGDVNGALAQLANDTARDSYRRSLQALAGSNGLPAFAAAIQDIRPMWIRGSVAHYLLVKTENGQPFGYHVYFVRNGDGRWHVLQF